MSELPPQHASPLPSTSQLPLDPIATPSVAQRTRKTIKYTPHSTLKGHKKSISSLKFSPDSSYLASASGDLPIHLHSLPHFNLVRTFNGHTAGISEIAFSADSAFLASASDDHTIRIWQIDNVVAAGENVGGEGRGDSSLRVLRGHTTSVFCVAWNPRGDLVASGGMDETVRIWDVQKGRCMKVLPAHSDPVSGVQFNRDGTMIVSGSWDGYIRIWDTATGQCLKTLVNDDVTPVSGVFFSPNSKFIFASTLDSTVRLWDYQADKTVKAYSGHVNRKYCIPSALTADGSALVTGSEDHKIFIWDMQTRTILQEIGEHGDVVMAIACHPTRGMIASGCLEKDPTIKIWIEGEVEEADESAVVVEVNGVDESAVVVEVNGVEGLQRIGEERIEREMME